MRGNPLIRCPDHPEMGFYAGSCPICQRDAALAVKDGEIRRLHERVRELEREYTEKCQGCRAGGEPEKVE